MIHKLHPVELSICWFVFIFAWARSLYALAKESSKYGKYLADYGHFVPGWALVQRYYKDVRVVRDHSNYEWYTWSTISDKIGIFIIVHFCVGRLVELFAPKYRRHIYLVYGMLFVCYFTTWRVMVANLVVNVVAFALTESSGSISAVWIYATILTVLTNNRTILQKMIKYLIPIVDDGTRSESTLLIWIFSLGAMRTVSFCVSKIWAERRIAERGGAASKEQPVGEQSLTDENANLDLSDEEVVERHLTLFDLLVFNFYPPLMVTGPLICYDAFPMMFYRAPPPWTVERVWGVWREFTHAIAIGLLYDFMLHFVFIDVLISQSEIIKQMDLWALAGTCFQAGAMFQYKYAATWGLSRALAQMDGVYPPYGPLCVLKIGRYGEMWKDFDHGLYQFFKKYIYVPLGGSRAGLPRQLFGSSLCFVFIAVWHGGTESLWWWSISNFFVVGIDSLVVQWSRSPSGQRVKERIGGRSWRYLRALITVPSWLLSIAYIQVFFTHQADASSIYLERLALKNFWKGTWFTYLFLFCASHLSIENDRWKELKAARQADVKLSKTT